MSTPDYQLLFESCPGLYLILTPDSEFKILAVSNAYLQATMTVREKIIGKGLFEVFPDNPDDPNADGTKNLRASLERAIENRQIDTMAIQKYDIRRPAEEGGEFEVRYWSPSNTPVIDKNDEIVCIIHSVEDVSELVNSQVELTNTNILFRGILEGTMDLVCAFDPNLNIMYFNSPQTKEYEKVFGRPMRVGMNLIEDLGSVPEDQAKAKEAYIRGLKEFHRVIAEYGDEKLERNFYEISYNPLHDNNGNSLGVFSIARNVTDRVLGEQRLIQSEEALRQANKELEAFSYSVSHDLRAPLRSVDGFSRILLEKYAPDLPDEAKHFLKLVKDSAQEMGRLVDDLLAFSRLSRLALKKYPVNMKDMVQHVVDELSAETKNRQIEIKIDEMPIAEADPNLLKQVWVNLISNALKFTQKCEKVTIEIGCQNSNPHPVYFVKDNGAGFDMRYVHKLFGVFQRLHRTEEFEGTGVGLAIVQRVIHRHNGNVWAEGEVGKGATFYFTLEGGTNEQRGQTS